MFAQQHDEGRWLGGELARLGCEEMDAGELRMGGDEQPAWSAGRVELERHGLRSWLDYILDARPHRARAQLVGDRG